MTYTHRNGETEPPTKSGWYFVKVSATYPVWDGLQMRYVTRLSKYHKRRQAYRIDSIGEEYLDELCEPLQWWGPVLPPWKDK